MAVKKKTAKSAASKTTSRKAKAAPKKARAKAASLKMRGASPGYTVDDLEKSIAWYRDVVGFAVEERWEQEGKLVGVSLRAGDATFMIGQDDWKKGRDRKKGEGFRIFCETSQDIDALAKGIEARGGTLEHKPTDQPWGYRDFGLSDPDGFKLTIGAKKKKR
jgi:uncharacterized glyoxalase superfamily protein PhnB